MAWSAGSRAWGRAAERLISTGPTNPVCQHGCPGRLVRLHGCERVAGHRSRFWFGRGSGASDEDSHTTACAGAKRASGEREPRCLQVVLSNRAEDARKLFSLALAKRKSHQAGPARADRVRPRAAIPIGGLLRPGLAGRPRAARHPIGAATSLDLVPSLFAARPSDRPEIELVIADVPRTAER